MTIRPDVVEVLFIMYVNVLFHGFRFLAYSDLSLLFNVLERFLVGEFVQCRSCRIFIDKEYLLISCFS